MQMEISKGMEISNGLIIIVNYCEILPRWINGQGIKDINWRMLVHARYRTLAGNIVAA